jgi:hypothetical protein
LIATATTIVGPTEVTGSKQATESHMTMIVMRVTMTGNLLTGTGMRIVRIVLLSNVLGKITGRVAMIFQKNLFPEETTNMIIGGLSGETKKGQKKHQTTTYAVITAANVLKAGKIINQILAFA